MQRVSNTEIKPGGLFVLNKSAKIVYEAINIDKKIIAVEAYIKPEFSKDKFYKVEKGATKTINNLFIYPIKPTK